MKRHLSIALAYVAATVLIAACAGHSPSATRSAAENLAATLPREVGDLQLDVKPSTIAEMVGGGSDEPFLRVLAEAGKTPADVTLAVARNGRVPLHVDVWAMRVRGLDAQPIAQTLYAAYSDPPPTFSSEVMLSQDVLTSTGDDGSLSIIYCRGDVAYMIRAIKTPANPAVSRSYAEGLLNTVLLATL